MKAFKAYDIRGVYNVDFTKDDCYKIGFFLSELLNTKKILIGRDARTSSPEIYQALTAGITDSGTDVYDIGLATTPMVYFATAKHGFEASVQITASHNPPEYNGMKVSTKNAMPVGYDTGLGTLKTLMETKKIVPADNKGVIINFPLKDEYVAFQKQFVEKIANLKIAVDCSNGMAALIIKDIWGYSPIYLYDTLDCTFPNHEPNPLVEENVEDLKKLVLKNNCDMGIIFDGDADRVMFVDEKGRFVSPDLVIALLGHYFLETEEAQNSEITVLQDIRTSKAVSEYLAQFNATVHTWKVGRAFAAPKLLEIDGIYGGELAGHYYFRNFFYSDSGIMAASIVVNVVADFLKKGIVFSDLIDKISSYANSGEINFKIENKTAAMEAVKNYFEQNEKVEQFFDFDGYRLEFADWWFNIRPSNTEPYLRMLVEAKSNALLEEKVKIIKEIIGKFS